MGKAFRLFQDYTDFDVFLLPSIALGWIWIKSPFSYGLKPLISR
jgi:hypothetical protein